MKTSFFSFRNYLGFYNDDLDVAHPASPPLSQLSHGTTVTCRNKKRKNNF